ncbi:hypothetical protein LC085_01540 [Bacillus tianshenii]|uniref:hypothetical protein n=1 Tax=Sutcliffiella tianshenii TaxID=1463404 RepID=UPI001CD77B63|nr:hypothetical protein [Bacillus tianshenii]MCA1318576.1 hypothetical protein [Bacillus tianshenii]
MELFARICPKVDRIIAPSLKKEHSDYLFLIKEGILHTFWMLPIETKALFRSGEVLLPQK